MTRPMHKLLCRQLKRAFDAYAEPPPGMDLFLRMIDDAYHQADAERQLLERALELSSKELLDGNRILREERQEFFALIERMPHMVAIRRGERFVYVNPAGISLLGYRSADEVKARPMLELIHPDDREQMRQRMRRIDDGAEEPAIEVRCVRGDGEVITLEAQTIKHVQYEGAPGVLQIATDVTERKKMQQRLMVADRMASVGTLAAGVAHEINNPLAYVVANLAYLEASSGKTLDAAELADCAEALREARQGAERVRNIVRDLKSFSRADEAVRAPVDVRKLLESSAQMAANEIRHRAQLVKDFSEVELVAANEGKLGQVFLNLLVNAAQALPEGQADRHRITAVTRMRGDKVLVEVRDTGSGIPTHVLPRIFDPFFTTKPVGVGTGLGLSICHGIVRSLGGEITVETGSSGTTFRVELPAARGEEVQATSAPARVESSRRLKVLVVDDEPLVGTSVKRTLASEHDVIREESARRAIERMVAGERFDVILCDLMMPEVTGMDLFERIQRECPEHASRVVFLSGGAFTPRAKEFLDRTSNPCIEKPFDGRTLRSVLAAFAA